MSRKPAKHAVYAGTRNLYGDMEVAGKSLVANSSVDKIHFIIEDDAFPTALPSIIQCHNVSDWKGRFAGPNNDTVFTYMAMARACYCELFPRLKRVVQFDCDAFCVSDVDWLWECELDGKWFAAAKERQDYHKPYGPDYYNIGVAAFNLSQMREDGAQDKLVNLMCSKKLWCVEQDALNELAIPAGRVAELPVRFNESAVTEYTDNPAVIHFASFGTTWKNNPKAPRKEHYAKYLEMTWKEALELHRG